MLLVSLLNLYVCFLGLSLSQDGTIYGNHPEVYIILSIFPLVNFCVFNSYVRNLINKSNLFVIERIEGDYLYNYSDEEKKSLNEDGFYSALEREGQKKDLNDRAGFHLYGQNLFFFFFFGVFSYPLVF